jgi:hypothetical protein
MVTPTPTTVQVKIQLRGDTAANWASVNPVLLTNELGLETDTKKIKVGDGTTAWNSLAYFPSIVTGGTVLGNLEIGTTGTLTFEGSTADGFETTLAVTDPTADRTITLPDQSGTVVVTGNASIVDADIAADAEIAVSKLADGAARQLLQTDAAGTGVEWTDNVDVPGTLDVTGAATFDDDVTIEGDLTVNGTTTTIDTETLLVKDKNIELAVVDTPTDTTADGGGITLKGATDKTITWSDTTDAWTSNQVVDLPAGSAATPSLIFGADVNTGIYSPGADQVAISTNGTGRLFVNADGTIQASSSRFYVVNTLDTQIKAKFTQNSTSGPLLSLLNNDESGYFNVLVNRSGTGGHTTVQTGAELRVQTGADLRFNIGGVTERARITSDGKLGLGTSSPSDILTIKQTVNGDSQITLYNDDVTASSAAQTNSISFDFARTGSSAIQRSAALILAGKEQEWTSSSTSQDGYLAFYTTLNATSQTEKVRITSGGNVGIGTTAPTSNLSFGATDAVISTDTSDGSDTKSIALAAGGVVSTSRGASIQLYGNEYASTSGIVELYSGNVANSYIRLTARSTSSHIQFNTGTDERARIDSSGRLLVGTSSTDGSGRLVQVADTTSASGAEFFRFTDASLGSATSINLSRSRGTSVGTNTIVQSGDALGYIQFKGANGTDYDAAAYIYAEVDGTPGASGDMPGRLVFSTTADGASSPTERMRISQAGIITFDQTRFDAGGGLWFTPATVNRVVQKCRSSTTGTISLIEFINPNGLVGTISTNGSATAYNTSSDYRLKENIAPLTDAADRLKLIPVHRFNFIADPDTTVDGFIAHEAQAVVPECVTGTKDEVDADGNPVYQGIDQSKLVPLLTAALQEALQKIETLEARLTAAGI